MSEPWSRRTVLKTAGALVLLPWCAKASPANILGLNGATMGTHYRVRIQKWPVDLYLPKLKRAIEQVLAQTEDLMSTYKKDSELSRFNRSTSTAWQKVSTVTTRIVTAGLGVQQLSAGAFNPAASPLVDYWGFGANPVPVEHYPANVPARLMDRVRAAGIETKPGVMRKAHAAAALDLNGIAKGDALDRIADLLQQNGIIDYLIEIGGEIRVAGTGPGGRNWRIGIDHPAGKDWVLHLNRGAVATSGDYVDYYLRDGKRICHIVDPRLGIPVEHALSMVSVVSHSAMHADAWATALFVMGPQEGWSRAVKHDMAAMFLVRNGSGFVPRMTPRFKQLALQI